MSLENTLTVRKLEKVEKKKIHTHFILSLIKYVYKYILANSRLRRDFPRPPGATFGRLWQPFGERQVKDKKFRAPRAHHIWVAWLSLRRLRRR